MTLGTTTSQAYGEPSYWDNRYAKETSQFDWYQKYPCLSPLLHLYLPPHPPFPRVLVLGCGNSGQSVFISFQNTLSYIFLTLLLHIWLLLASWFQFSLLSTTSLFLYTYNVCLAGWLLITYGSCGFLAAFSEGMVDDGYTDVVNIDISSVVIDAMKKKYTNRPQLKCIFCFCVCFSVVIQSALNTWSSFFYLWFITISYLIPRCCAVVG